MSHSPGLGRRHLQVRENRPLPLSLLTKYSSSACYPCRSIASHLSAPCASLSTPSMACRGRCERRKLPQARPRTLRHCPVRFGSHDCSCLKETVPTLDGPHVQGSTCVLSRLFHTTPFTIQLPLRLLLKTVDLRLIYTIYRYQHRLQARPYSHAHTMEVMTDNRQQIQQNQQHQQQHNTHQTLPASMQDWVGNSYGLSCDKLGEISWTSLNGTSQDLADTSLPTVNDGFAMEFGPDIYNMTMQPYDTTQYNTIAPMQISTTALDDAASSLSSWPVSPQSPASFHAAFSDIATDSTYKSPGNGDPDPSFAQKPRRHSHQHSPRPSESLQNAGAKRRYSELDGHTTASPVPTSEKRPAASDAVPVAGSNKRKRTIREKNRTAATKYRNKTKRSITELQETEHQLSEKHNILSAHVECLRNEILSLKTEILRHGTCESKLIQEYIMRTAKQL